MTSLVRNVHGGMWLLKVAVAGRLLGIEYVAAQLRVCPRHILPALLRRFGCKLGDGVVFKGSLAIDNASGDRDATGDFSNLRIGSRCYVGVDVMFDLPARIVLEDEVVLSAGVRVLTHADCGERAMAKWYPRVTGDVKIGAGSWIGAGAIVLAGVELGRCCVVAAGAVVTDSFPDHSVVAGAPAKLVKTLE